MTISSEKPLLLEVDVQKKIGHFSMAATFNLSEKRCGIFGTSGSGKSTLMHILAGLLEPDHGKIVLNGTTLFDQQKGINLPPQKRRIGVVFQHAHLFPHLNVKRNLLYGWQRTAPQHRGISLEAIVNVLHLSPLMQRSPNSLSGGERQRVALGRTILANPRLLLMDEPLTGLDLELKFQIIPYLRTALDTFNIPLLFISHSMQEIRMMTNEVLVFANGQVQQHLATEELARRNLITGSRGYANMLYLKKPSPHGDLWSYEWGGTQLITIETGDEDETVFELGARDITLCKCHPQATSARNLLPCTVVDVFGDGNRMGVELDCNGSRLISQIVPQSVQELEIKKGSQVVAMIKASAFRKLY